MGFEPEVQSTCEDVAAAEEKKCLQGPGLGPPEPNIAGKKTSFLELPNCGCQLHQLWRLLPRDEKPGSEKVGDQDGGSRTRAGGREERPVPLHSPPSRLLRKHHDCSHSVH